MKKVVAKKKVAATGVRAAKPKGGKIIKVEMLPGYRLQLHYNFIPDDPRLKGRIDRSVPGSGPLGPPVPPKDIARVYKPIYRIEWPDGDKVVEVAIRMIKNTAR